jgi:glutaredoxin 3
MNNTVFEIYTKPNCSYCVRAKNLLVAKELSYDEIDLQVDGERDRLLKRAPGARTVPQIFAQHADGSEEYIGGYSELVKWLEEPRDV